MSYITVTISNTTYEINEQFIENAKSWFRSNEKNIPTVFGKVTMGIFVGNVSQGSAQNRECDFVKSKIARLRPPFNTLGCEYLSANQNPYFFAPFVIEGGNKFSFDQLDQGLYDALASNNNFTRITSGDVQSHLLYTVQVHENQEMITYKRKNTSDIFEFKGMPSSLPFIQQANRKERVGMKKISISEDLYRSRGEEIASGLDRIDRNKRTGKEKSTFIPGIAMLFSKTIRDLPQKVINPILERFNQKMMEAGITTVEALDMPLIAFLGKNDIWNLDGRAIVPLEIEKKSKKGIQEIEITYLDLSTMQVEKNESQELKDRVERIIIERQEMKQLRINALIRDRNAFIEKMQTSSRPSAGGFPAIIFMMNKLDSLLNSRASTLKMQIASMTKKSSSFEQNPLLLEIEQQSEEEMTKPFGESTFYTHPADYLKSILREMHYKGKLEQIMRMLENGELQRKYNPENDPRLNAVFDALIEFGRQLRERKEEKNRKEDESKQERKERFDTGVLELPVLREIQKIEEMSVADMPIETSGISPELYKSEGSKMVAPSRAMEYIRINLREVEITKDRLAGIRMILVRLNEDKNINARYFRTTNGQRDIQKIKSMFAQLHGFITRYVNSMYKDGKLDKAKIGSSADPIANLNIAEYLLVLNTKVGEYIRQLNENSENRTASSSYAIKFAQDAAAAPPPPAAPPLGGMPGMPGAGGGSKAGDLRGPDESKINEEMHDDELEVEKLREHFDSAYKSGHSIEDSVILAIQGSGSRRAPSQIDVAIVPDSEYPDMEAPFVRGVFGIDLGPVQDQQSQAPQ